MNRARTPAAIGKSGAAIAMRAIAMQLRTNTAATGTQVDFLGYKEAA